MKSKCRIQKYDASVTEAPFQFITLGECEIEEPELDDLGQERYARLSEACSKQGHTLRFYSSSSEPGYVYDVTVFGEMEANDLLSLDEIKEALVSVQKSLDELVETLAN